MNKFLEYAERFVGNDWRGRAQIRQGDVLLTPVPAPESATRVCDADGVSLAGLRVEGERTGHAHVLPGRVYDTDEGVRLLFEERPEVISHPEHGTTEVPAGWWRPAVQREHVPAAPPRPRYD